MLCLHGPRKKRGDNNNNNASFRAVALFLPRGSIFASLANCLRRMPQMKSVEVGEKETQKKGGGSVDRAQIPMIEERGPRF